MNGSVTQCADSVDVTVTVQGKELKLNCLVSNLLPGYDMLLGMDAVPQLGGVYISDEGGVTFGVPVGQAAASAVHMKDRDYEITFADGKWLARWTWTDGQPALLTNSVPNYHIRDDVAPQYDRVVESWIEKGWLQPYDGPCDGIIPLLAVVQENKNKIRPVLDYRELNQFVSSHTAESEVCGEKLRCWRRMGNRVSVLDLRDAYLQIHIDEDLWKFQVVEHRGRRYCLTRLGFGLNVAPKIMSAIVRKVLSLSPRIAAATDSYVDDVIVDESKVSAVEVLQHFRKFGLDCKDPVPLENARVLGLRVHREGDAFFWQRDNVIHDVPSGLTRRQLFSICGQLTGHYPVAGWLRPACSFLKRLASSGGWDSAVSEGVQRRTEELVERVKSADPVRGRWDVVQTEVGSVWCDASSIAVGIALEVDGCVVEDRAWLRKDDSMHINLAELEAVVKGINAAVSWGLSTFTIYTDSATVNCWMRSIIHGDRRIKTHSLSEVLVKRRLSLVKNLLEECCLTVDVVLVSTAFNKADPLTRVPREWLRADVELCSVAEDVGSVVLSEHSVHHLGVDRTHYLASRNHPNLDISRDCVDSVVKKCTRCARVDPAPVRWESGELSVAENWNRLAADVTHYSGQLYLTFVDCGPSRFTIWRRLAGEGASDVCSVVEEVCREHGPPNEFLLDNALAFRSQRFSEVCRKWGVRVRFRCAYRASGNGIVERIHRTVKRMAARSGGEVCDMAYWYNTSPKERTLASSVPVNGLFTYEWRTLLTCDDRSPGVDHQQSPFWVGQRVYVKPGQSRCTTVWPEGRITHVREGVQVDVDGVARHIADVRPVPSEEDDDGGAGAGARQDNDCDSEIHLIGPEENEFEEADGGRCHPRRQRRPPDRFGDFVLF